MRARTSVVVEPGRVADLRCEPPLTLRHVYADDAVGLCLVGTAAGPLPGDDLGLAIAIADHARADLQATGASIAQGRSGERATTAMHASIGNYAHLRANPGPLIVCRGAAVDVTVTLKLTPTAHVEWHELVVLGRTGEEGGAVTLNWDVTRAGRPVLRQTIDLADPILRAWNGMTSGCRVLASVLLSGPSTDARTCVLSPTAVAQRVDDHTLLITVLAADAADAVDQVEQLRDAPRLVRS